MTINSRLTNNQDRENSPAIFYHKGNGSLDGSVLANKTFHIVYHIMKHDFKLGLKSVIGILYNEADKNINEKLYFQTNIPMNETLTIPVVLEKAVYHKSKKYNAEMTKKVLFDDSFKKKVLHFADKLLMERVNQNNGNN